jgi:hypothetical protein
VAKVSAIRSWHLFLFFFSIGFATARMAFSGGTRAAFVHESTVRLHKGISERAGPHINKLGDFFFEDIWDRITIPDTLIVAIAFK